MLTKMMRLHTLVLIMIMVITTLTADSNNLNYSEQETRLREELYQKHHIDSRPSQNITIEMETFRLLRFDMHETEQYLEVHGFYNWKWIDPRLSWNQTKYSMIDVLNVPARKIWRPDVVIFNSVDWLNLDNHGDVNAVVYPNGNVMYIPPAILKATCIADMTYWPHDVHMCKIKHGSWVLDGNILNLTIKDDQFDLSDFVSYEKWRLVNHNVTRNVKYWECCPEPYTDITFEMRIKRNDPALVYSFKIPAVGLSFLSPFVFLLPPGAGEKLLLSGLLLLIDLQFLIHTVDVVQHSSLNVPIVIRLVSEQLYLVLISLIVSVVTLRMARTPHGYPVSSFIMAPLRALAPFILLGKDPNENCHPVHGKDAVELDDSTPMTLPLDAKKTKEPGDWILIAAIVDRIFFIVYCFIVMANLIAYTTLL